MTGLPRPHLVRGCGSRGPFGRPPAGRSSPPSSTSDTFALPDPAHAREGASESDGGPRASRPDG